MKFWIIDIEKELYLEQVLNNPILFLGLIGYPIMWIFIAFFLATRATTDLDKSMMGVIYGGLYFLIIVTTYCRLGRKISLNKILPEFLDEKEQEFFSSNNKITIPGIPEMEHSKRETPKRKISIDEPHLVSWNVFSGLFWTVFTITTHSFFYAYILSCTVPVEYHIIFMVNIAFPVTMTLICFTGISTNILYNIWVDVDFAVEYLFKSQYKKMLMNVYIRLGWVFLIFAFISALLSSFCGIIHGDSDSTIVFILWMCLIVIGLIAKIIQKYSKTVLKFFAPKNN